MTSVECLEGIYLSDILVQPQALLEGFAIQPLVWKSPLRDSPESKYFVFLLVNG